MSKIENYTDTDENHLRLTNDSVVDISSFTNFFESDSNTVIVDAGSENESIKNFDLNTLFRNSDFQAKKKLFEIELMQMLFHNETDDLLISPADNLFNEFYEEFGIAATETLNALIVKNIHRPHILVELLHVLSSVQYEKFHSFGQTLLIAILGLYKENENPQVTDLVIKCIENWKSQDFIDVLQNIESKTGFIRLYKKKVLTQLLN